MVGVVVVRAWSEWCSSPRQSGDLGLKMAYAPPSVRLQEVLPQFYTKAYRKHAVVLWPKISVHDTMASTAGYPKPGPFNRQEGACASCVPSSQVLPVHSNACSATAGCSGALGFLCLAGHALLRNRALSMALALPVSFHGPYSFNTPIVTLSTCTSPAQRSPYVGCIGQP